MFNKNISEMFNSDKTFLFNNAKAFYFNFIVFIFPQNKIEMKCSDFTEMKKKHDTYESFFRNLIPNGNEKSKCPTKIKEILICLDFLLNENPDF